MGLKIKNRLQLHELASTGTAQQGAVQHIDLAASRDLLC